MFSKVFVIDSTLFGSTKKQMIESKERYNDIFARHLEDTIEDKSEYDFNYLKQKRIRLFRV